MIKKLKKMENDNKKYKKTQGKQCFLISKCRGFEKI
jgi:hypothetical protein